jgi:hypothetical protein
MPCIRDQLRQKSVDLSENIGGIFLGFPLYLDGFVDKIETDENRDELIALDEPRYGGALPYCRRFEGDRV